MPAHHDRRLSDKVFSAFNQACDIGEFDIARALLAVLDSMLRRAPRASSERRKEIVTTVAAHERLWLLMHSNVVTLSVAHEA